MLLFWRIRYLDSRDKQFKDRDLWLDTRTLDPVYKVAVEATHALSETNRRAMLRFRHLFHAGRPEENALACAGTIATFFIPDYFEDETGQELSLKRMAVIKTGNPEAMLFPPGTRAHDIAYYMANKSSTSISEIELSPTDANILGYFTRDLRELLDSALCKDGPGALSNTGSKGQWFLKTAISDEEIRSFVMIFRRLYMESEPASFAKSAEVFSAALSDHPIATWVQAAAAAYSNSLENYLPSVPILGPHPIQFSRKLLIDVYLYTQYAHQPDKRRSRQFSECLAEVGGNRSILTWLFLTETWKCAIEISNAGCVIADFYDRYCMSRGVTIGVIDSLSADHHGFGVLEKKADKEVRILREKAEELAKVLWEQAGQPPGGHSAWITPALDKLKAATGQG